MPLSPATRQIPVTTARQTIRQMLDDLIAHTELTIQLTKRGTPVALLIHPSTHPSTPTTTVQASDLQSQFAHTLATVATGQPVLITQYNRAQAVLVPVPNEETPMSKTSIITVFSHAGGVGKTSSTRDIGYELGQLGYRVLLIDLDAQANLTTWLGVDPNDVSSVTLYQSLVNDAPLPSPIHKYGMDLIPADLELSRLDIDLSHMPMGGVNRLKKVLQPLLIAGTYDFILLDTPPSLGKVIGVALYASQEVIIPVSSDPKGVNAISTVHDMIRDMQEFNPDLRVLTHLLTKRDNTALSKGIAQNGAQVFTRPSGPLTALNGPYGRCVDAQQPIGVFDPGGRAHQDVQHATRQILEFLKEARQ